MPPVEFVEKKLRSYCKYQEEASKNKKCAPSPPALLRRKACGRSPFAAVAQQRFVVCRGDATKPNSMCYYIEPVKRDFSTPVANGALSSLTAATHSFRPS